MTSYQEQYIDVDGTDHRPHVSITMNVTKPTEDKPALLTLGVLLLPEVALAQSSGDGGAISKVLDTVIELLTGVWGRSAAIVAVAALRTTHRKSPSERVIPGMNR